MTVKNASPKQKIAARRKAVRKSLLGAHFETMPVDPVYVEIKKFVLSFLGHDITPPPALTEYASLNDPDFHFTEALLTSLGEEFNLLSHEPKSDWKNANVLPSDVGEMFDSNATVAGVIQLLYAAVRQGHGG